MSKPGVDLTLPKAAEFFGNDEKTCRRWVADGCPAVKDQSGRWILNSASVSLWLRNRERESALGEVSKINESEARRRKLAAEAGIAEHELAMKQGAAVAIADFEKAWSAMIGSARAKALNFGAKVGPMAMQAATVAEAKDLIDAEMRELLSELSEFNAELPIEPAGYTESDRGHAEGQQGMGAPTGSDDKRVVGSRKKAQSRG